MALSLYSGDCGSASEANQLFASEKGLLVLRPGRGCCGCSLFFTVPSGCYALVTRHGADLDNPESGAAIWPSGFHGFHPPWVGVSHLVTKQSVVLDLPVKACKTRDNVTVSIDMALAFRIMGDPELGEDPELVRNFVYAVKPKGLEQQLRDAQEEAVRLLARSLRHTEIYGIRTGGRRSTPAFGGDDDDDDDDGGGGGGEYRDPILEGAADEEDKQTAVENVNRGIDMAELMREQLNKQFVPQGILIQSIMIKSVTLPEDITAQMSDKTMVISQNAEQHMYHENEMQENRMEQKVMTLHRTFQDRRDLERTEGQQKLNTEKVTMNDIVSQAEKSVSNIKETAAAHIESLRANNALEVQRVLDETYAITTRTAAEAEKESAELLASTKLEVQTLLSDSELRAARLEAEAQLVLSKSEGTIAPWIEKKKAFETAVKRVDVYERLAENDELIVVGNGESKDGDGDGDDEVALVAVADSILAGVGDKRSDARTRMVAELAVLRASSASYAPRGTLA